MVAVQGGGGHPHNGIMPSSMAVQPVNGVKTEHQQHYQHSQRVRLHACRLPLWQLGAWGAAGIGHPPTDLRELQCRLNGAEQLGEAAGC